LVDHLLGRAAALGAAAMLAPIATREALGQITLAAKGIATGRAQITDQAIEVGERAIARVSGARRLGVESLVGDTGGQRVLPSRAGFLPRQEMTPKRAEALSGG
jgi:hypothetical protein